MPVYGERGVSVFVAVRLGIMGVSVKVEVNSIVALAVGVFVSVGGDVLLGLGDKVMLGVGDGVWV